MGPYHMADIKRTSSSQRNSAKRSNGPAPLEVGEVFGLLDRVARRLRQIHEQTVRHTGLTPAQVTVLVALCPDHRVPPAELAVSCGCTRATMTGILDTLEKNGLITRSPHPEDRRSVLLSATARGRRALGETQTINQLFGGCCAGLSSSELEQLRALLEKLGRSLSKSAPCCRGSVGGES
jgi:DNA-binding MarR family transcriptional regulator